MKQSLTHEEILTHQHPMLPVQGGYKIVRYEVDIDPDLQTVTTIVLTLRSSNGEVRRLRFQDPAVPEFGPFQIPIGPEAGPVYIVDTSFRGWESRVRIEVGSLAEDQTTFLYAQRVDNES